MGTDLFSLKLSNKKYYNSQHSYNVRCEWIKIIPIFQIRLAKNTFFGVCHMRWKRLKITGFPEKHQCVVACHMASHWGPGLQPRHVPWLGIEPVILWFTAHAQFTELHQPGQFFKTFLIFWNNYFLANTTEINLFFFTNVEVTVKHLSILPISVTTCRSQIIVSPPTF